MAKYLDNITGKEYNSRLACAWDIYMEMIICPKDEYQKKHGRTLTDNILDYTLFAILSPVWFPLTMLEPFPYQKPRRIEKIV